MSASPSSIHVRPHRTPPRPQLVLAAGSGVAAASGGQPAAAAAPLKALAGVLLLLPLLLAPLAFLWYAGRDSLVEHSRLGRYRAVSATVLATAVEKRPGTGGTGPATYVPRVSYRYFVAGVAYQASRLTPPDRGGSRHWAERRIASYRPGGAVTAWYDPEVPGRAFLERDGTPALSSTLLMPGPVLALALWLAASAHLKRRRAGR